LTSVHKVAHLCYICSTFYDYMSQATERSERTERTPQAPRTQKMLRFRVDTELFEKADRISNEMGTSTPNLVRMFLAALVREGALPFRPRVQSEEDEMLGPIDRRRAMQDLFNE
jgi:addiction module RelB/DinJ family antitoxin